MSTIYRIRLTRHSSRSAMSMVAGWTDAANCCKGEQIVNKININEAIPADDIGELESDFKKRKLSACIGYQLSSNLLWANVDAIYFVAETELEERQMLELCNKFFTHPGPITKVSL